MGIIERSLTVSAKSSKRIIALFDSGSSFSIVHPKIIDDIGYLKKFKKEVSIELGDGHRIFADTFVLIGVRMNNNDYYFKFLVMENPEDLVIGVDFLQEFGHTLEFKKDRVIAKNIDTKNRRGVYVL